MRVLNAVNMTADRYDFSPTVDHVGDIELNGFWCSWQRLAAGSLAPGAKNAEVLFVTRQRVPGKRRCAEAVTFRLKERENRSRELDGCLFLKRHAVQYPTARGLIITIIARAITVTPHRPRSPP